MYSVNHNNLEGVSRLLKLIPLSVKFIWFYVFVKAAINDYSRCWFRYYSTLISDSYCSFDSCYRFELEQNVKTYNLIIESA